MSDQDLEGPVPDVVEQQQEAISGADEPDGSQPYDMPLEADEADVAEQGRGVDLEEDDYR
jgi:hypothetical protein